MRKLNVVIAVLLFFCIAETWHYAGVDAQTTPPDAATALAQITAAVNNLQTANAALTAQLTAANNALATYKALGFTILQPGTELTPYLTGGPGNYYCIAGKYPVSNCPTNLVNQVWVGQKGAEWVFAPVKGGAGGALQLNAPGTVIDGFNFVTAKVDPANGFPAGVIRVAYGVNYRNAGTPVADGFPHYFGQGNVIRNCVYDASMAGTYIYGGACGTVIENNYFHRIAACAVYDCGYETTVLHNMFPEGSQGEHGYRSETDGSMGLNLTATQSCLLFNWWDNRTSPPKKEDMTLRQGNGNVIVGNVSLGWDLIGKQNVGDGIPYGSPSYWLGNILPNAHGAGAEIQANENTTIYFDGNFLTGNTLAPMLTVYAAGNLVTTDSNKFINVPAGAKPPYATVGGIFKGQVVALKVTPATQPVTQPTTLP